MVLHRIQIWDVCLQSLVKKYIPPWYPDVIRDFRSRNKSYVVTKQFHNALHTRPGIRRCTAASKRTLYGSKIILTNFGPGRNWERYTRRRRCRQGLGSLASESV